MYRKYSDSKFVCNSEASGFTGFHEATFYRPLAGVTSVLSGELTDPKRLLLSVGSSSTQAGMNSVVNPEIWNAGREVLAAWMLFYPCFIEISMMTLGDTSEKNVWQAYDAKGLTLSVPTGTKVGEWNQWRLLFGWKLGRLRMLEHCRSWFLLSKEQAEPMSTLFAKDPKGGKV